MTPKLKKTKSKRNIVRACVAIVVSAFCEQNRKLKQRSSMEEQTNIGNSLTVIEMEIKSELKKLL